MAPRLASAAEGDPLRERAWCRALIDWRRFDETLSTSSTARAPCRGRRARGAGQAGHWRARCKEVRCALPAAEDEVIDTTVGCRTHQPRRHPRPSAGGPGSASYGRRLQMAGKRTILKD